MSDREALRAESRLIHGHGHVQPAEALRSVAAWCEDNDVAFDSYGEGELIESFEQQVADRLGYESARFMPSGTMAQQIAMRVWVEQAGHDHIGMHPTSHLELHEERGYSHLQGLRATLVGPADAPLLAEHLDVVPESLAALLTELPVREAGGLLPTWEELVELKKSAAGTETPLHLDGARLWECGPAYQKGYNEICAGFDSCYVSFYKGIGALPGAMLLGSSSFISQAQVWQRRMGGTLFTQTPKVASAAMLWEQRLKRMPDYLDRVRAMAGTIGSIEGVSVLPNPPHVNMMHLFIALDSDSAATARDRVAEETGIWLFGYVRPADLPGHVRTEVYVGEAAMDVTDVELENAFGMLMESA